MEDFQKFMWVVGSLMALTAMLSVVLQIVVGIDPASALIFGFIASSFLMTRPSETEIE